MTSLSRDIKDAQHPHVMSPPFSIANQESLGSATPLAVPDRPFEVPSAAHPSTWPIEYFINWDLAGPDESDDLLADNDSLVATNDSISTVQQDWQSKPSANALVLTPVRPVKFDAWFIYSPREHYAQMQQSHHFSTTPPLLFAQQPTSPTLRHTCRQTRVVSQLPPVITEKENLGSAFMQASSAVASPSPSAPSTRRSTRIDRRQTDTDCVKGTDSRQRRAKAHKKASSIKMRNDTRKKRTLQMADTTIDPPQVSLFDCFA
ncbi:hypothetical protein MIND_00861100 [Mycena indigotica]|uniref:Uncharacterized protein n=1 Tax=Mycena indigotica TaxID=2126181 RepID=A0A8H6SIU6_9AGAR|nr:uncharacterized protein MIND_00861100 [Mycena indigotica]KAF7299127.1 hypothetical protein MIND_00861100 [Mycena indigotica]